MRKSNRGRADGGAEGVMTVRTATQYGCMQLQWQPVSLPANETEETLAAKMVTLQQLASQAVVKVRGHGGAEPPTSVVSPTHLNF